MTWHDVDGGLPPRTVTWPTADPTAALAEVLGEMQPVDVPGLPRFCGGAVGYAGYDTVRYVEKLDRPPTDDRQLPDLLVGQEPRDRVGSGLGHESGRSGAQGAPLM